MTRQQQLDFIARNYGEWDDNFALVFFLMNGRIKFSNDLTTITYPFFSRADVEQRKAELQNKLSLGDAPEGAEWLAKPNEDEEEIRLPIVGDEYELKPYWHKVKVVCFDELDGSVRIVLWDYHDLKYDFITRPDYLRPIKSDLDKWIEAVAEKTGLSIERGTLKSIYDTGLAKLPENV